MDLETHTGLKKEIDRLISELDRLDEVSQTLWLVDINILIGNYNLIKPWYVRKIPKLFEWT